MCYLIELIHVNAGSELACQWKTGKALDNSLIERNLDHMPNVKKFPLDDVSKVEDRKHS